MKINCALPHVVAAITVACLAVSEPVAGQGVADANGSGREAQRGDIALTLVLMTTDGGIAPNEPLLARVETINFSDAAVELIAGNDKYPNPSWIITNSAGAPVALTPRRYGAQEGIVGVKTLLPRGRQSKYLVVSALYSFPSPGRYTVTIQQNAIDAQKDEPPLATASASLTVLAPDAARVKARCDELFEPFVGMGKNSQYSVGLRAAALYSVRHDAVVPSLEWLAGNLGDAYACRALRRINTPLANATLAKLAASTSEKVRKAVLSSLKRPFTDRPEDIEYGWAMGE